MERPTPLLPTVIITGAVSGLIKAGQRQPCAGGGTGTERNKKREELAE